MSDFEKEFEEFVHKYTELLIGEASVDLVNMVKIYAIYSHINKTMPALAKHWITDNPEAKEYIRHVFEEIQKLNQEHRSKTKP